MDTKIEKLRRMIQANDNIVFFGGAGVSTESGIPDFRSKDGIYNQKYDYPPEEILSHSFYKSHPEEFYRFYREKILIEGIKPNKAHKALARLEKAGKLKAVITQNIDGLHHIAGSENVLTLHGSSLVNYCEECGKEYDIEYIRSSSGVPRCECGGVVRPDVVLFGEQLDSDLIQRAVRYISGADMLIVGGTSLVVYPAAGFIDHFKGNDLVIINRQATNRDSYADLVIKGSVGETLECAVPK